MITPVPRSEQIAIISVNWRRADLTLACLAALRTTVGIDWHFYLVDNASGDDSIERLSNLGQDVTLIVSDHNAGWSGGNNAGIKAALAAGHTHLFRLNNDASVRPDTIMQLVDASKASLPDYPILGPVHQAADDGEYTFVGHISMHEPECRATVRRMKLN